jgi:His-Xaa-Ser system protein HxsD
MRLRSGWSSIHAFTRSKLRCELVTLDHLCVFRIERQSDRQVVHCSPRDGVEGIETQLRSAVIDFSIRESVEERTGQLRDLIWRTAFAEARGTDTK